ncbi:MAG TPA: MarR family winged helix-turn-helix transcriptional regulator [Thermoplasmata archaeon]|nr:MarR family winged helix-turn-helix transcriptional regulator [Thermoplasmata archaeon]
MADPTAPRVIPGGPALGAPGSPGFDSIPASDLVRLSMRVLVHLSYQPSLRWDDTPGDGGTQLGISRELAVTQGAVSKVLERLVAASQVRYERGHVIGQRRRQRVYRLTQTGELLAHRIRERLRLPEYPARGTQPAQPRDLPQTDPARNRAELQNVQL